MNAPWIKTSKQLPPRERWVLCHLTYDNWHPSYDREGVVFKVAALRLSEHGDEDFPWQEFGPGKHRLESVDYWMEIPRAGNEPKPTLASMAARLTAKGTIQIGVTTKAKMIELFGPWSERELPKGTEQEFDEELTWALDRSEIPAIPNSFFTATLSAKLTDEVVTGYTLHNY